MAGQWLVSDNPEGLRHQNLLHRMVFYTILSAFPHFLHGIWYRKRGEGDNSAVSPTFLVYLLRVRFLEARGGEEDNSAVSPTFLLEANPLSFSA